MTKTLCDVCQLKYYQFASLAHILVNELFFTKLFFNSRLSFLKSRKNNLTIISPLSGYSVNIFSADTLIKVINNKELILKAPIKVEDIDMIKKGQTLIINVSDLEKEFTGLIVSVSPEVKFLNNRQVIFVSIKIDNNEGKLLPGMVKEINLKIKQIKFSNYIIRFFTT